MSYFGIPIRNGLPIGLGSLTALAAAINSIFSPSSLFAAGEQGVWYDPSDLTTLFQDSAGTTPVTAVEQPVGKMLDKSGRGNHATQATSTKRPVLSARYNLLTKTEDFSDAVWVKASVTAVNTNETTDPLGGNTADKVTCTSTVNTAHIRQDISNVSGYSYSFYAKAGTSNFACFTTNTNATYANFNLSTGVVSSSTGCTAAITLISNGWYRCVITNAQSGIYFMILGKDADPAAQPYGNGNWTSGNYIYIWGASLVPADQASLPYQRVNTATDYNAVGYKTYLKFDGVDDALATGSIDFTSTDKMFVSASLRKLSDAATGIFAELSITAGNNGTFYAPLSIDGSAAYTYGSNGSSLQSATYTNALVAAPVTNVFTGISNISAPVVTLRLNGSQVATNTGSQGTGNYGNYPLYIGSRAGTSLPANIQLYGLVVRGALNTATQTTSTESYLATKAGITI